MLDKKKFVDFEKLSTFPQSLQKATLKSYHPKTQAQLETKQAMIKFVKDFDLNAGKNVILAGNIGTGKSHLAVSVVKAVVDKGHSGVFIDVARLLSELR
jgi:DNA replication protein DnaC